MAEPVLLIVDFDGLRRHHLVRTCLLARPDLRVIGAKSEAEARLLLQAYRPNWVAVAADVQGRDALVQQVIAAELVIYGPDVTTAQLLSAVPKGPTPVLQSARSLILIGASTGGIAALEQVLRTFPPDCPPVLIVQHIRDGFVEGLVRRLDQLLQPKVHLAQEGQVLHHGAIHIAARSDRHLGVSYHGGMLRSRLIVGDPVAGHRPAVDLLFRDGANIAQHIDISAALLTGMGADGADGMCALHAAGAHTIAQDRETSVVWGMPRMAIERGGVQQVLPLARIGPALLRPATGPTAISVRGSYA
ncbi:CheB methylesterase [Ketogulonicigenium vulgare Y25]|uniref:protein-glutamate methylesterase n=1 Tax=Ketogulonicigenium vulgare (strain WSH-001) TaxID=759362 RepID=F9Y7G1_KETVW|nr:CheB methylesterase [Ketogulonicigenium vulgare Y25]AEM41089.1 chemotaxis response regulator [Ketogulonicigenium vulgare WSH-001]ALJ81231.1 chemotaxis protein CheB [Ketogulonicigenium vulgare]ANW35063.1 chemotaxis protein CheB [Ketogulonicigenium vulgare]AOZ54812.1 CheB methylesterase [Ketogulonicigenium vulgare]